MKRIVIVVLLSSLPAAASQPIAEKIHTLVEAELTRDGVGGLSIAVIAGGELVDTAAFGYADIRNQVPATAEHVYRIGSITKQFTALALLKLAHSGIVGPTDPVERYVPEIHDVRERNPDAPPITLLQLATMTSGLAREPEELDTFLIGPASEWADVVVRALSQVSYDFAPDTRYQYSNIGYAILGLALERASSRGYMDYVRGEILEPLGMKDSDFVPRAHFEDRIATGHQVEDGAIETEASAWEHLGRGYKVPNGAMYSTVGDLARFLLFQLGHGPDSVLPAAVIDDNFSRVNSADGDLSSGYGAGFRVLRRKDLVAHGHTGTVAGYRAAAFLERSRNNGVVILRNVTGGSLDVPELALTILELLTP